MDIGEEVWTIVMTCWGYFEKRTVGDQLVRSTDSIAANISEGNGRYHFGEKRQFTYYMVEARYLKQKHGSKKLKIET